jgi:hypothetical protein
MGGVGELELVLLVLRLLLLLLLMMLLGGRGRGKGATAAAVDATPRCCFCASWALANVGGGTEGGGGVLLLLGCSRCLGSLVPVPGMPVPIGEGW